MEVGSILAIVSLVIQVVSATDKVIKEFDKLQNTPKELRDFRIAAARLQRHLQALQNDAHTASNLLHPDDLKQIEETLILCDSLFQGHDSLQRQGVLNNIVRGTWTIRNNQKLADYKGRIDAHYTTILIPTFLESIRNRDRASSVVSPPHYDSLEHQSGEQSNRRSAPIPIESIRELADSLDTNDNRDNAETILRELDQELQKCWTKLGLQEPGVLDTAGLIINDRRRQSSLTYEVAPVVLRLEGAPEEHRNLKLERVHVLARDNESRILLYQNRDVSIQVTHIVPKGSIPWTNEHNNCRVSFLNHHVITVKDGKGYHVYHIDPKYHFSDTRACEKFQSTLRERQLHGAFLAAKIKEGRDIKGRRQVIRFWKREEKEKPAETTMTFFQSYFNGQHREIGLDTYQPKPRYCARTLGARRPTESEVLELQPKKPDSKTLRLEFVSVRDATRFKYQFEALHPANQASDDKKGNIPTISMSPPSMNFPSHHEVRSVNAPSISSSYYESQTSFPSSVFSESTPSATPTTTAAPTPSDQNWNPNEEPHTTDGFSLDENDEHPDNATPRGTSPPVSPLSGGTAGKILVLPHITNTPPFQSDEAFKQFQL